MTQVPIGIRDEACDDVLNSTPRLFHKWQWRTQSQRLQVVGTADFKLHAVQLAARDLEASHRSAELVIIPVVRSNTNLSAAFAVAVHAQGTIGAPLILPVDLLAGVGGGFGAATVVFTIPLTGSSGEDPGVSHGQHGGKGGDDGDGIFHCGGSFERLDKAMDMKFTTKDRQLAMLLMGAAKDVYDDRKQSNCEAFFDMP
ncbi:hypothetical protein PENSTE_c029G03601 [Penicillium steckii]|uniref:Uncharacterized protein n=1 Tax=Penicillium steckii TaxID=303698 RepID=A0A1V6SMG7_9EURO|nr:hypothetical protein PENSTE_c029G03601 [Penicillium steckii]